MKKYKIKYQDEKRIKILILKTSDISKETLPINIISIKEVKVKNHFLFLDLDKKISDKEINLLFYELNIMLEANITFNDALDILIKNKKNKKIIVFLESIKYSLTNSSSIIQSIKKFNVNYLVGAFLEISQNTGNISLNIKTLYLLLEENTKIKEDFIKSIRYPLVLMISFFISLISIFYFVIPKFELIFAQTTNELPFATKVLLQTQFFFENIFIYILIFLVVFFISLFYFYKNSDKTKYFIDKFFVKHFFLIKDIYLNMQVYKVFLILDIMINSNHELHKAIIFSKVLLKNQYLLDKIALIDNLLQNGKSISYSFSQTQIFDDIVLNLIHTGEISNSLNITVKEIKKIYKIRFNEKIKLLTALVEPVFLLTIMGLVLWIVLAIFMPIWDMGNMIKI